MIIDQEVGRWWEEHVNDRPAWRTDELPDASFKGRLLAEGLAIEVRRDVLCLCAPDQRESPRELVLGRFWAIVGAILSPYAPYALQGPTAMRLHFGDASVPRSVYVATERSRTRISLLDDAELVVDKEAGLFATPAAIEATTSLGGATLTVESPESALVRIRPRYLVEEPDLVMAFLKSAPLDLDRLKALCLADYRPAKFKALADWCAQLGRDDVAAILRAGRPPPRKLTPITAPAPLISPASLGAPAHVTRFVDHLQRLRVAIDERLGSRVAGGLGLAEVLALAEAKKRLDTYHSSTIEGYRVSLEEIDVLMGRGGPLRSSGGAEAIERRMALRGYLDAHRLTVQEIERMFGRERVLTERLAQDIHAQLFKPTLDAGLLTVADLRSYRRGSVFLRGSRYVPPASPKVDALMQSAVELVNDVDGVVARALLIHYAIVTIHPYDDGNGRTARLLMNYVLATAGAPWVTIRVDDREVYFRALERAQCDSDFEPLIALHERYFSAPDVLGA